MSALLLASRKGMMWLLGGWKWICAWHVCILWSLPSWKVTFPNLRWLGRRFSLFSKDMLVSSLEGRMAPENRWLEDKVSFWKGLLAGAMLVSGSVSSWSLTWHQTTSDLLEKEISLGHTDFGVSCSIFRLYVWETVSNWFCSTSLRPQLSFTTCLNYCGIQHWNVMLTITCTSLYSKYPAQVHAYNVSSISKSPHRCVYTYIFFFLTYNIYI